MASTQSSEEYDFLEKPGYEYYCPVTLELLKDPRETDFCCGSHLSGAATELLEPEGKPCPIYLQERATQSSFSFYIIIATTELHEA